MDITVLTCCVGLVHCLVAFECQLHSKTGEMLENGIIGCLYLAMAYVKAVDHYPQYAFLVT